MTSFHLANAFCTSVWYAPLIDALNTPAVGAAKAQVTIGVDHLGPSSA